jgi:nucleoside-diphosphate-sugar epimerase
LGPRFFWLHGEEEAPTRVFADAGRALLAGKPFRCRSANFQRDFIWIDDAAEAVVRLLASPSEGPVNVCSGVSTAIGDAIDQIRRVLGQPEDTIVLGEDEVAPIRVVGSTRRLFEATGWRPRLDLSEQLRQRFSQGEPQ